MIIPKPLLPGAHVALIAPAGPLPRENTQAIVEACQKSLADYGLTSTVLPGCTDAYGYLAGTDEVRAAAVMQAFCDDSFDGIFCVRGGYGVQRILDMLDFDEIAKHPKWFGGYSDITALHIMLGQRCGLVSYHTPMPSTEYIKGLDAYTETYLKKAIAGELTGILPAAEGAELATLRPGEAEGILCGGNLSLVSSSLGTPYEIDTKGKILFLEDINEAPYRIDGMLNHLRLAGKFEDCAGILLGAYTDCVAENPERSLSLTQVFEDLMPTDKPVLAGYSCGHCLPTMSLPLGMKVRLDADAKTLTVL